MGSHIRTLEVVGDARNRRGTAFGCLDFALERGRWQLPRRIKGESERELQNLDDMMQRALALPGLWRRHLPSLSRRVPLCTLSLPHEEPHPGKLSGISLGEVLRGFRVFVDF